MAIEPTPTLKPWDSGGCRSWPRPSISHRWLNWCSAPEAGREEAWACMASPDMTRPSTSRSSASWSPAASSPGRPTASRSGPCTSSQTWGSTGSTPSASATSQSAPAVTLPSRSPYPDAVIAGGAPARTSRSATTARGAGQVMVCL